ncbi:MAG TPA: hypothetical protein VKH19_10770 [Gemmatimonadaceae bacterium]|nr:hypothetical protein [Gemmatimonadaceae bacterium]
MDVNPALVSRFSLLAALLTVVLFATMLFFLEVGRRIGIRSQQKIGEASRTGVGVVDSAVYAVLALLLGFMFNGATGRFDARRDLVTQEVSTMSTAWQRIDALPAQAQPTIRDALKRYVDAVVGVHVTSPGSPQFNRHASDLVPAQDDLWTRAMAASLADAAGDKARMLLLPSLNEMFDVVDRERLAVRNHPPLIIWVMLSVAALAAALFAGYSMALAKSRNWLFILGTAATISIVTYVVLELEYPRLGFVRVSAIDRGLVEVRQTMR